MLNCTSLLTLEPKYCDDEIQIEIKKAIQVCNLFVEEKNQNWLHFRWVIWEEICRLMPIKTKQPIWPFGKLVYYNKRFIFGDLDIWLAHYWNKLNGGILWIENSYLKEYKYKPKKIPKMSKIKKTKQKKTFSTFNNFLHSKDYTAAKYLYLLKEEKKYAKEKSKKSKKRKSKNDKII